MTTPASTRPRVVVLLAMVVLALLLLLTLAIDAAATDAGGNDSADGAPALRAGVEYTVHSGDTLWAIASLHLASGDDVRLLVEDIRAINGLENSVIHPGQVLLIPTAGG